MGQKFVYSNFWRASVAGGSGRSEIDGSPSCAVLSALLCSDLTDTGLHHCRLVARWMDAERLRNFLITP